MRKPFGYIFLRSDFFKLSQIPPAAPGARICCAAAASRPENRWSLSRSLVRPFQHLRLLRRAHLVRERPREGRHRRLSAHPAPPPRLSSVRSIQGTALLEMNLTSLKTFVEAEVRQRNQTGCKNEYQNGPRKWKMKKKVSICIGRL